MVSNDHIIEFDTTGLEEWEIKAIRDAIIMGISDGTRPHDKINRVEVMAMTTRAVDASVKLFVEVLEEAVKNKV